MGHHAVGPAAAGPACPALSTAATDQPWEVFEAIPPVYDGMDTDVLTTIAPLCEFFRTKL